jgi:hypothetical protein
MQKRPTTEHRPNPVPADPDLVDQAKPGHGVPSQDPDAAAQYPIEHDRALVEQKSVFAGAAVMVGAAAGAVVGTAVAGPVGVVVGGTVGALVGALSGVGAGALSQDPDHRRRRSTPAHP